MGQPGRSSLDVLTARKTGAGVSLHPAAAVASYWSYSETSGKAG